jgi:3D (Asp-Asp-Asp) domain-containing protein
MPEKRQTLNVDATSYMPMRPNPHPVGSAAYNTYQKKLRMEGGLSNSIGGQLNRRSLAVDKSVIPLGSPVYNHNTNTWNIADDVGPAIRGNEIDIPIYNEQEMTKFGRQKHKLSVFPKGFKIPVDAQGRDIPLDEYDRQQLINAGSNYFARQQPVPGPSIPQSMMPNSRLIGMMQQSPQITPTIGNYRPAMQSLLIPRK